MDTNKKNKTILDRLDNVELELLHNDTDYAKQFLKEEGIDPDNELKFASHYIRKVRFMALGLSNKQQDEKLLELAFLRLKELINENSQKATDALINLLHSKTPSFVRYRKLENWSDEEIKDVLMDVDIVKLMEELKKEK